MPKKSLFRHSGIPGGRGFTSTPRRGSRGPGSGVPGLPGAPPPPGEGFWTPGSPGPWPARPGTGLRSPGRAPGGPREGPGPARVGGFTSTPRGGPPRFPGAPERGVDVKPLPRGGQKWPKWPFWGIPGQNSDFRDFGQKWLFLAIFWKKSPVATGLKCPISPKNRENPQNAQKVAFSAFRDPRRAGFYINPSRRPPAVPRDPGGGSPVPGRLPAAS